MMPQWMYYLGTGLGFIVGLMVGLKIGFHIGAAQVRELSKAAFDAAIKGAVNRGQITIRREKK